MMKRTRIAGAALAVALCTFAACTSTSQEEQQQEVVTSEVQEEAPEVQVAQQDTIKGSIPSEATGNIGDANLNIKYHAPGVKGRIIWGGLVPYNQVWVTGAHMATSLETDKALLVDGKELPAGKYALFTIPGEAEWTVIINKDWEQHLADKYTEQKDVLRVQVKPEDLAQHQERLKYEVVEQQGNEGAIKISWEKKGVTVPVKTK
ncbi:DUF2911 domain-containing protein [Pontibacter cellulosilyticus]|uniref:DUF2911 domain-containing protein n=1 Tax=Pontibacter cellulosilyticus TaxID=1720253 RepID=A0A923N4V9_9BACT|nr:DUF2911 domain-containing protein [Pontibacter cellulosilyticus]MBC5991904.1 DUF2911 domain-containing protein [Pontibacter cellulosilyticus]